MNMMTLSHLKPTLSRPFAVSTAITSGKQMCIVTVHWTGKSVQLIPSSCMSTAVNEIDLIWPGILPGLELFFAQKGILHLGIRRGAHTGPRQASPLALKVELALETLDGLKTTYRVSAHEVAGWLRRRAWRLPLPDKNLDSSTRKLQQRGIETAGFVVSRILNNRAAQILQNSEFAAEAGSASAGGAAYTGAAQ